MASLFALDLDAGPAGAAITAANSGFTAISGTASSTFTADAYTGPFGGNYSSAAQTLSNRVDFASSNLGWFGWYMKIDAYPAAVTTVAQWYAVDTLVGALRVNTDGTLFLRDGTVTVATSGAVPLGAWFRVAVKVNTGVAATGHALRLYTGTNRDGTTPTESLTGDATRGAATLDNFRVGVITSGTITYQLDRFRADNSTEPAGAVASSNTVPTANAGPDQAGIAPYATVTLTGAASTDPDGTISSYAWTQTSGPAVTLSGAGATRTFTAPATLNGGSLTFGLTVTDNSGATSTQDTVVVTVTAHNLFTVAADGTTRLPVRRSVKS